MLPIPEKKKKMRKIRFLNCADVWLKQSKRFREEFKFILGLQTGSSGHLCISEWDFGMKGEQEFAVLPL